MAQKVLIMGESGTGKSTSLRNCDPATTAVINPVGKPLPFKNHFEMLNNETDARKIVKYMKEQCTAGKKLLVVDDFQYILAVPYMNRIKETGWDKYNDFGANYFEIIDCCKDLPDDVVVVYMTHLETLDNGLTTVKLIGKLLREKITIEGLFTVVLRTGVNEAKYYFYTQNSGKDTVKSPLGMFTAYAIDNDLNYVVDKIRNYYELGDYKSDDEMNAADQAVASDLEKPDSKGRRTRGKKAESATPTDAPEEKTGRTRKSTAVYNKLINSGVECGQDYNVYRYVDDIFIFAKSEELATHIVEKYSEIARKYLLQLNETKLFSSRVPFILDGWLNETNGFTNRMCDMLFNSKEEQKAYVEKISAKEDDAETPTSDVLPYLLKSHVVRYGSKAKQSIMNQLNELICNYPNKDRTIIAYFLSSILNHIGKNKDKCTIFKNDVKGSTVFSFLDLTFYAYSFFPNYGNTQKLLQIISYVRDEYDIFEESTRLQALINKYAFIFDKANINDVVNLFLFCRQAKIEIPYLQEECIVRKIKEKDDPILWATYLMYSQYNRKYSDEIRSCIEKTLLEKINAIRVQKSVYEYREFWWILIFNKCPFITNASQNAIDNAITLLNVPTDSGCTHTLVDIFKNYLQNSPIQFFDWDIERNDFLRTLTFKTHEKSIFKNYKENAISLAWGSI